MSLVSVAVGSGNMSKHAVRSKSNPCSLKHKAAS